MKEILWHPVSKLAELTVPAPRPARDYLPDWYKSIGAFHTKKPVFDDKGAANRSLKVCMPFGDAITAGYIQETWQDISVNVDVNEDGEVSLQYFYPTEPKIIGNRLNSHYPVPEYCHPVEFVFHPAWSPELPKGWSMLYTQPFNQPQLVTHFLTGIIDSDSFTHSEANANMPFFVKKSFSGIIPKGTPIVQMIPIRREEWESTTTEYDETTQMTMQMKMRQYFWGGYKKLHWTKKNYQ